MAKKLGLGTCPLSNMILARDKLVAMDIKEREAVGIQSKVCPGIVRKNDWTDGIKTWLCWGLNTLVICNEFSRQNSLVWYVDSTKMGHLGLKRVHRLKKQLQFLRISIQPGNSIFHAADAELIRRNPKGIVIAEGILTKQKTADVAEMISGLMESSVKCVGKRLRVELAHTDCAGQLKNGLLRALRDDDNDDHVDNQMMYSNVHMIIFLRLAVKMSEEIESTGDWVESAKWAYSIHKKHAPCGIHECGSHVWRAFEAYPKSTKREDDAPEMKNHVDAFSEILTRFAERTKALDNISVAYAYVSITVLLFSVKQIKLPKFTTNSIIQDDYNEDEAMDIARDMATFMKAQAQSLCLHSDSEMNEKLADVMTYADKPKKQSFMGGDVIDNMVKDMQTKGMPFHMVHLKSVNAKKQKGTIGIVYIYSPFDDEGDIEPQCVEFEMEVSLPFNGGMVDSYLYSPTGVKYIRSEWGIKLPLWCNSIVSTHEKTNDKCLPANNINAEAMNNIEQNITRDMLKHTSEPASYWHYRYENLSQASKFMITEMDRYEHYVGKLREQNKQGGKKKRKSKKKRNKSKRRKLNNGDTAEEEANEEDNVEMTEDSRKMKEEDESDMIFDRRGARAWIEEELDLKEGMIKALTNAGVKPSNNQWQVALFEHGESMGKKGKKNKNGQPVKFMTKPTFNKWIEGRASKKLKSVYGDIIRSYIAAQKK